jgi:hypothetical protein
LSWSPKSGAKKLTPNHENSNSGNQNLIQPDVDERENCSSS